MPNLFKFRDWISDHNKVRVIQEERETARLALRREKAMQKKIDEDAYNERFAFKSIPEMLKGAPQARSRGSEADQKNRLKDLEAFSKVKEGMELLSDKQLCSQCFKLETKALYRDHSFDMDSVFPKREKFLAMRPQQLDMKEHRMKAETIKRLASNKRSTEREQRQAEEDYLKQFEKGDPKQQGFAQDYNERFAKGIERVDNELHQINETEYIKASHHPHNHIKRRMPLYPGGHHKLKQSLGLLINEHRAKI